MKYIAANVPVVKINMGKNFNGKVLVGGWGMFLFFGGSTTTWGVTGTGIICFCVYEISTPRILSRMLCCARVLLIGSSIGNRTARVGARLERVEGSTSFSPSTLFLSLLSIIT